MYSPFCPKTRRTFLETKSLRQESLYGPKLPMSHCFGVAHARRERDILRHLKTFSVPHLDKKHKLHLSCMLSSHVSVPPEIGKICRNKEGRGKRCGIKSRSGNLGFRSLCIPPVWSLLPPIYVVQPPLDLKCFHLGTEWAQLLIGLDRGGTQKKNNSSRENITFCRLHKQRTRQVQFHLLCRGNSGRTQWRFF